MGVHDLGCKRNEAVRAAAHLVNAPLHDEEVRVVHIELD